MQVVVASGHMTDSAGRSAARFPEASVERVRKEIARQLRRWNVGSGDLVVCGGARGSDLIAAEEGLAAGASVRVCLALPREEFLSRSVELAGTDWRQRFDDVERRSDVRQLDVDAGNSNIFAVANEWMIDQTLALDASDRHALIVWDGQEPDGVGGTAHMATLAASHRLPMYTIDPTPRPSADRQWSPGPKKLLALDGGGIRGILTLGILGEIESQLRDLRGQSDLVLSDYFDYISGTSTGAIIATALSLGKPVEEITGLYRTLGAQVFKRNWLHPLVSLHPSQPLTGQLERIIGADTTLGDQRLQTLLMIVLHATTTDSPWLLSNNPSARYNRPERALTIHPETGKPHVPDRNLDLSLVHVTRGSTAAPTYFAPERIRVGDVDRIFQDGGVTPYNNPALLLASMATQPEYELCWPSGEDNLLLVSVGTGLAPVPRSTRKNMLASAFKLPGVFMNGASIGQDYLCRVAGTTRFGPHLDNEIGRVPRGAAHFAYARYNASLNGDREFTDDLRRGGATPGEATEAVAITKIGATELGKLNSIKHVDQLYRLGQIAGRTVDVSRHFANF
jgi:predicted acylesterase/phospholipase RssA